MTTYALSIGYLSGYGFPGTSDEAWGILKEVVRETAHNPARIVQEALACGAPLMLEDEEVSLYAEAYGNDPGTIQYFEDGDNSHVVMNASGSRILKEHTRRAFCRLVIAEMHRKGIEVNLRVS